MRSTPTLARARRLAVTTTAAVGLACTAPAPDPGTDAGGEAVDGLLPSAVDARYLTHLVFAAADGRAFFGSFDQTAGQDELARTYDVWWTDGGAWQSLVQVRDTIPAARAAWRLLPAGDMSVRIGDAGQVVSIAFRPVAGDTVRLLAGEEVSVWTGPTGQRESLGLAVLETGATAVPGVLFFRRAARALQIAPSEGWGRTFVFADTLGNGLLIHEGTANQPAVAHTWLHGIDTAWGDVVLARDSLSETVWRFEIPDTELRGEIRSVDAAGPSTASAERLEAVLSTGDGRFLFAGVSATLPFP